MRSNGIRAMIVTSSIVCVFLIRGEEVVYHRSVLVLEVTYLEGKTAVDNRFIGFKSTDQVRTWLRSSGYLCPDKLASGDQLLIDRKTGACRKELMDAGLLIVLGRPLPINELDEDQLIAIPGIGKVLAARIAVERKRRSGFKNIEELDLVKGIGPKKLETLRRICTLQ